MGKMGSSDGLLELNSQMNEHYLEEMLKNGGAPGKAEILSFANVKDTDEYSDLKKLYKDT